MKVVVKVGIALVVVIVVMMIVNLQLFCSRLQIIVMKRCLIETSFHCLVEKIELHWAMKILRALSEVYHLKKKEIACMDQSKGQKEKKNP